MWRTYMLTLPSHDQRIQGGHAGSPTPRRKVFRSVLTGLTPSTFAVSSALKSCAKSLNKWGGVLVHAQLVKFGFLGCVYVATALIDLYSKFGEMGMAKDVFYEMGERNVVSWNSILSGYCKCGDLGTGRSVFDEMPERDVVSWNLIVLGYVRVGDMEEALHLFEQMPEKNAASWNTMLSGYVDSGRIELARSLLDAMPVKNNVSYVTMVAGYAKCGDVESARKLFDEFSEKNLFLYNAMIACYAQNSQPKEAIQLFEKMVEENFSVQPDRMTLASVVSACSQLGDMRFASYVLSYMEKHGIQLDDHLATALIDLYSKCGNIDKAYEIFQSLENKDLVSYSAMISGFGINGKVSEAVKLLQKMKDSSIAPNLVTFTGLLTAYNHSGLIEDGYTCFSSMKEYGLLPSNDQYAIMVDLLARAGKLEEAYELIKNMPMQPSVEVWGALLLACSIHNNVEFGEIAANCCSELEPDATGYYTLLANIYASLGRWDDTRRLKKVIEMKKLAKTPGCSWVESN
ncbi:hypothetical protein ACFE04_013737 [Oxalis oulophora]